MRCCNFILITRANNPSKTNERLRSKKGTDKKLAGRSNSKFAYFSRVIIILFVDIYLLREHTSIMSTFRAKGNEFYQSVFSDPNSAGKHPLWKIRNLQEALKLFQRGKAAALAKNQPDEWLKCCRSVAICCERMACEKELSFHQTHEKTILYYTAALCSFCAAVSNAKENLPRDWTEKLIEHVHHIIRPANTQNNHEE